MLPPGLVKKFPKLRADGAKKTSDATKQYNCIAWSASRDKKHWWQPLKEEPWDYWPADVPDDFSFDSFIVLFEKRGYERCSNYQFEVFFKKVALYADTDGFTHVCDELNSGAWTSKLAAFEDIQHNTLEALEGNIENEYGKVRQILRRRCNVFDILARMLFKFLAVVKSMVK